MKYMFKVFRPIFDYKDPKKQLLLIVLLSFVNAFIFVRLYSLYISHYLFIFGYHIHHFYFGMLLLSIGGVLGLLSQKRKLHQIASVLIGVGLGLFADEIGLLLNCTTDNRPCVYYFPDTLDIIGSIVLAFLVLIILTDYFDRQTGEK